MPIASRSRGGIALSALMSVLVTSRKSNEPIIDADVLDLTGNGVRLHRS